MKHVTVLATSEDNNSKSQLLARAAAADLSARAVSVTLLDLREKHEPAVIEAAIHQATHLIFAVPIYNFDVNARAKQLIEDHGGGLEGKTVGLICQAGGNRSYMSVLSFANSLMLDFRCWIVPRFVYAISSDFQEGVPAPELLQRVEGLVEALLKGNA